MPADSDRPASPLSTAPADSASASEAESSTPSAPRVSTHRTRRRRARLREHGIRSVVYDLPGQLVEGLAAAAALQRLTPSEYLTRLVAGELVRTNVVALVFPRKEES